MGRQDNAKRVTSQLSDLQNKAAALQPYQVSLAWLLSRPAVASAIVGAETVEEISAHATADNGHLSDDQLAVLTACELATTAEQSAHAE